MNALSDLPVIDADAIAAGPGPIELLPFSGAIVTFEQFAVAPLEAIRAGLVALAGKYDRVAFDLKTPKGLEEAKAARHDLRENGRYAVQRAGKKFKDDANAAKKKADALVIELAAIVEPVEDKLDAAIKAREAEIEAEREAKRQAEAARVQKHRDAIANIRAYLTHAQQPGMTSLRIAGGMKMLGEVAVDASFEEFQGPALAAQVETLKAMRELHERVLGDEMKATEVEAQRIENERVAAENARVAAENARIAAELAAAQAAQQNAQAREAEGLVPGTPGPCASSEAESATASPSGDEGPAAHADTSAAGSDEAWGVRVTAGGIFSSDNLQAIAMEGNTYEPSEAAATVDAALDLVEADDTLLRDALALVEHAAKAFDTRFPSHPKPEQAWWTDLRAKINALQPALLMRLAEKRVGGAA